MAKTKQKDLADRLHVSGLRRKVAETLAAGVAAARPGRKPPKRVDRVIAELKSVTAELEDKVKGGPAKRKAAAQEGGGHAQAQRRQAQHRGEEGRAHARQEELILSPGTGEAGSPAAR